MAERPEPSDRSADEPAPPQETGDGEQAYSDDEEAAVAARLEDLGYM